MELLFTILLILILFFVAVMIIDCNRFVVRRYQCVSPKIRKDTTVIFLSDLHGKSYGKENEKLVKAIRQEAPDLILCAGDLYTSVKGGSTQSAVTLLQKLRREYPVFCGNGNHEQKTKLYPETYGDMYQEYVAELQKMGAVQLVNEKAGLPERGMELYGLEIGRGYYRKGKRLPMEQEYLTELLGKPDPYRYNILIAHNPDYFKAYEEWGADLVLSGHVHGGLMRLPFLGGVISPAMRLFPEYDGGLFMKGNAKMVLGRGLGTHTLPIRIFNPGELVVIRLKGGK